MDEAPGHLKLRFLAVENCQAEYHVRWPKIPAGRWASVVALNAKRSNVSRFPS